MNRYPLLYKGICLFHLLSVRTSYGRRYDTAKIQEKLSCWAFSNKYLVGRFRRWMLIRPTDRDREVRLFGAYLPFCVSCQNNYSALYVVAPKGYYQLDRQNGIRFQRTVCFEFSNPEAFRTLQLQQMIARGGDALGKSIHPTCTTQGGPAFPSNRSIAVEAVVVAHRLAGIPLFLTSRESSSGGRAKRTSSTPARLPAPAQNLGFSENRPPSGPENPVRKPGGDSDRPDLLDPRALDVRFILDQIGRQSGVGSHFH